MLEIRVRLPTEVIFFAYGNIKAFMKKRQQIF